MKNRGLLLLEIVWIIVGIACLAAGTRSVIRTGGYQFIVFFVMALVSFGFAWIRHKQRTK
jgi:hypothetical protein